MSAPRSLGGELVSIRRLEPADAAELHELRERNADFLAPWEPRRPAFVVDLESVREQLSAGVEEWELDRSYGFGVARSGALVGGITLGGVMRGAFRNAILGYWLDEASCGRGYATDAVRLALRFAFEEVGLHRVQAAVMPRNARSLRVLARTGFREEGLAVRYLEIAGVWEDHRLFALTREEA